MIKIIHIAPTSLIAYVNAQYNRGLNMVLTHLVLKDESYREAMAALPGVKYLDNSFFELGYCMKPKEMVEAAKMVGATVLICPDGTTQGLELFKEHGFKVMCIPKSADQFRDFMWSPSIDMVGLSEEHFAYRHCPGVRYEVLRDNIEDGMPKKKIHLLGATDSVRELSLLKPFEEYIESWDSSAAIWQGHLGNQLAMQKRKDCTHVEFDKDIKFNLLMDDNIRFIQEQIS